MADDLRPCSSACRAEYVAYLQERSGNARGLVGLVSHPAYRLLRGTIRSAATLGSLATCWTVLGTPVAPQSPPDGEARFRVGQVRETHLNESDRLRVTAYRALARDGELEVIVTMEVASNVRRVLDGNKRCVALYLNATEAVRETPSVDVEIYVLQTHGASLLHS